MTTVIKDFFDSIGDTRKDWKEDWKDDARADWTVDWVEISDPVNSVLPSITGNPWVGSTLTASNGTWTGGDIIYTRQWKRDGVAIAGATATTRVVALADIGSLLTVTVTATNNDAAVAATSAATTAVLTSVANTGLPTIVGTAQAGVELTSTTGTWTGGGLTYQYQWLADDLATLGYQIANVGGTRVGGSATGLANDATVYTASIVADTGAGTHTRPISITGSAAQTYTDLISELVNDSGAWYTVSIVGGNIKIVSTVPGVNSTITITDTDLFSSLTTYVAILAGVPGIDATGVFSELAGAVTATFTPATGDVGKLIKLEVTATNDVGTLAVNSLPTAAVIAA